MNREAPLSVFFTVAKLTPSTVERLLHSIEEAYGIFTLLKALKF
jgi:hypothetical protein